MTVIEEWRYVEHENPDDGYWQAKWSFGKTNVLLRARVFYDRDFVNVKIALEDETGGAQLYGATMMCDRHMNMGDVLSETRLFVNQIIESLESYALQVVVESNWYRHLFK